jgi:cell wall-associated NlpC family hydrolase
MHRQRHITARWKGLCGLLWLALAAGTLQAREAPAASGVIGVNGAHLDPVYWITRQAQTDAAVLGRDAIAAQNRRLLAEDDSTRDISTLPATLAAAQVRGWIEGLSKRPTRTLYDIDGRQIDAASVDGWIGALALDEIPATQPTRYGLVVRRADLRTFPTRTRVFSRVGDTDIDRFQENAFFPGTPVALVHESADGQWWFVVGDLYAAWIEKRFVAEGDKPRVFGYARHPGPYLVVTGATVRTTTTPDEPRVSDLQLDMGIRLPWRRDWPGTRAVNGQAAYTGYVVDLPVRDAGGSLSIVPALLPRTADVSPGYLPLTRANLLRQSFKFLGERYGWGHSYGTRDCSGFVSEVYRSMGVVLPRNTSDQSVSPVLNRVALGEAATPAARAQAVADLQVGDLVYIPGHVMMVIGFERGMPYVIHDTNGGSWLGPDGTFVQGRLNGVSVTPLTPLRLSRERSYVDGITNIQRIRATQARQARP